MRISLRDSRFLNQMIPVTQRIPAQARKTIVSWLKAMTPMQGGNDALSYSQSTIEYTEYNRVHRVQRGYNCSLRTPWTLLIYGEQKKKSIGAQA